MSQGAEVPSVITRGSKIEIGLLTSLLGIAVYGVRVIESRFQRLETAQVGTTATVGALTEAINDMYTLTAASEQALRTALANPGMKVADPRNPNLFIESAKE